MNSRSCTTFSLSTEAVMVILPLPTFSSPSLAVHAPTPAVFSDIVVFWSGSFSRQGSQWSGAGLPEQTWVVVHPDAAQGMAPGDTVRVESALGSIEAELRFDAEQRRDVAIMPKGGHFDRGHSANALIEAHPTDIGLGAAFLDCRVAIRRL